MQMMKPLIHSPLLKTELLAKEIRVVNGFEVVGTVFSRSSSRAGHSSYPW
jgi:hypothetical protein